MNSLRFLTSPTLQLLILLFSALLFQPCRSTPRKHGQYAKIPVGIAVYRSGRNSGEVPQDYFANEGGSKVNQDQDYPYMDGPLAVFGRELATPSVKFDGGNRHRHHANGDQFHARQNGAPRLDREANPCKLGRGCAVGAEM